MRRRYILAGAVVVCLLCSLGLQAQQSDSSASNSTSASDNTNLSPSSQPAAGAVPRLIKFAGIVKDLTGKVPTGVVGLTFSLYELPEGGNPLWTETQSLSLDALGRYTALLGANSSEGLPLDLFTSGKALWVGVQPQLPGQPEQPRVLLVAVPYSLKSSDADTLGGLPASAYMLAPSANTAQGSSVTPLITLPPPCVSGTTASASAVGLPCPVTPDPQQRHHRRGHGQFCGHVHGELRRLGTRRSITASAATWALAPRPGGHPGRHRDGKLHRPQPPGQYDAHPVERSQSHVHGDGQGRFQLHCLRRCHPHNRYRIGGHDTCLARPPRRRPRGCFARKHELDGYYMGQ